MYEVVETIGFRKFRVGDFHPSIEAAIKAMESYKPYKYFYAEKDADYDAADIFADGEIYAVEKVH